jgi:hypothetical protein
MDAADLRRAILEAFDAEVETERFFKTVASSARAREHALTSTTPMLSFALDVLLPVRKRGTERYLRRDAVDRETLERFVEFSERVAVRAIDAAGSPDDLADAVIAVLDDLHSYLLAHNLVDDEYLAAEQVLGERLTPTDPLDNPPDTSESGATQDSHVASSAANDNLALAA